MIKGIGVDTASIKAIKHYMESASLSGSFIKRTFSQTEQEQAKDRPRQDEYFASRFAAKEAVFKALAHILPEKGFDLRIVETLNHDDGCPYVNVNEKLRPLLELAGVSTLHISITSEDDYATAFVIAEG